MSRFFWCFKDFLLTSTMAINHPVSVSMCIEPFAREHNTQLQTFEHRGSQRERTVLLIVNSGNPEGSGEHIFSHPIQ